MAVVTEAKADSECPADVDRKSWALRCIDAEVDVYNSYLTGEVYGFDVETVDGDGDSCWGFFSPEEALAAGIESISHLPEQLELPL